MCSATIFFDVVKRGKGGWIIKLVPREDIRRLLLISENLGRPMRKKLFQSFWVFNRQVHRNAEEIAIFANKEN